MPYLDDPDTIGGWFTVALMILCFLGVVWVVLS